MTSAVQESGSAPVANFSEIGLRLLYGAGGGFYALLLLPAYIELSERWSYLGFYYRPVPYSWTAITIIGIAVLGACLPIRFPGVVAYSKWLLYYALFVPALLIPPQQGMVEDTVLLQLWVLLWISTALFILLLKEGRPIPAIPISARLFWGGLAAVFVLGHLVVLIAFRDTLSFASFDTIYEQRTTAAASVSSTAIFYLLVNLASAVNPFVIVTGLSLRRYSLVAAGVGGQILIYSTIAGKIVLATTLILLAVHLLFRNDRFRPIGLIAGMLTLGLAAPIAVPLSDNVSTIGNLVDLIYLRTLSLPGVLMGAYTDFFSRYPVTYLSHSLIGQPFSTYPYPGESVGQVIGRYVTPNAGAANNYNANFIAGDGVAGFGVIGVPIIMLIAGVALWFASRLVGQRNRAFICTAATPVLLSFADSSLFTLLLTGGGVLLVALLYLHRGLTERTAPAIARVA